MSYWFHFSDYFIFIVKLQHVGTFSQPIGSPLELLQTVRIRSWVIGILCNSKYQIVTLDYDSLIYCINALQNWMTQTSNTASIFVIQAGVFSWENMRVLSSPRQFAEHVHVNFERSCWRQKVKLLLNVSRIYKVLHIFFKYRSYYFDQENNKIFMHALKKRKHGSKW